MKTEIREVYKCDHCNKMYQRKHAAIAHEPKCEKNPDNIRACRDCVFLEMIKADLYEDAYNGEIHRKVDALFCTKKDHYIYPPKAEHKGKAYEFGDKENNPMPKECEEWKDVFAIPEGIQGMFKKTLDKR